MYRSQYLTARSQSSSCTLRICVLLQTQPDSSKSNDNGPNWCTQLPASASGLCAPISCNNTNTELEHAVTSIRTLCSNQLQQQMHRTEARQTSNCSNLSNSINVLKLKSHQNCPVIIWDQQTVTQPIINYLPKHARNYQHWPICYQTHYPKYGHLKEL